MRVQLLLTVLTAAGAAPIASGQTIQLPSFSSISVNTTVLVPDSGPSPYARDRRPGPSLFRYDPMPALPAAGNGKQIPVEQAARRPAAHDSGLSSVATLQQQRASRSEVQDREAQLLVEKARQAKSAGKSSVALNYYRAAAKSATGNLKANIDAEMLLLTRRKFQAAVEKWDWLRIERENCRENGRR